MFVVLFCFFFLDYNFLAKLHAFQNQSRKKCSLWGTVESLCWKQSLPNMKKKCILSYPFCAANMLQCPRVKKNAYSKFEIPPFASLRMHDYGVLEKSIFPGS